MSAIIKEGAPVVKRFSKAKLHYFGGYGRAEPIRMLLAHAKIPYEDITYKHGSVILNRRKEQGLFEFGQLPVLQMKGPRYYSQSISTLRFLGIKHKYYPPNMKDAQKAWLIDSTIDSYSDTLDAYYAAVFSSDAAAKPALINKYFGTTLPHWLGCLNNRLV